MCAVDVAVYTEDAEEKVSLLLLHGSPPMDSVGTSILHHAAWKGDKKLCAYLYDCGYDPFQENAKGIAPVHIAAARNSLEITKMFVSERPDSYAQLKRHPMIDAGLGGSHEIFQFFFDLDVFVIKASCLKIPR
jgi:ankyrin repeat protein